MSHKNAEMHSTTPFPFNILEAIAAVSPQESLLLPSMIGFFLLITSLDLLQFLAG